jgi:hypothetical protein
MKNTIQTGQELKWCVYRHIRLDKNVPFYIGIGKVIGRHKDKNNRNKWWKNIVAKTQWESEILFEGLTKKEAAKKEKEFIKIYGRMSHNRGTLCNITAGGEGTQGVVRSAAYKLSSCLNNKDRKPITIKGILYPSLRAAGRALGYSSKTIKRRHIFNSKAREHCIGIEVNGIKYPSLNQASIATGLTIYKLKRYYI